MVIQQASEKTVKVVWLILCMVAAGRPETMAQDRDNQQGGSAGQAFGNDVAQPIEQAGNPEDVTVSVSWDGIVEMHIQDGELYVVLQQLLLKSHRNIVFGKDVGGTVTVGLYNVTIEQALDAILKPNGFAYRQEGNFIYVYTQEELDEIIEGERVLVSRIFRLNYISPADASKFIEPLLTPNVGTITMVPLTHSGLSGGGTSTGNAQSLAIEDIIVVRDYEHKLLEVEKTLAELDKRPKQVLVEATILRATLNETNALGIDFNVLGGVNFEMLAVADGRSGLIPNGPNIALAGSVGSTGNTGSGTGSSALGARPGATSIGTLNNAVPISKLDDLTLGVATNFAANVPNGGLTFGLVTDKVSAFIRALESVTDVTVLSNPKVLTLNKQEGHVLVGSRDGFLTAQITTETSSTQSVDFLETGTQLRFRPFISNDGYVRMQITPSDSTGGVDARGLPFERTTQVTTNILVKDGYTILIGGLFRDVTSTGRSQIPLLGSLPFVGSAFRSTNDATVREEVIILLTVHIIEDESEYAAYSEEVLDDMERLRVGIRESMQLHGRERLAQANYHSALEYANQGKWDMAEWHTKLAIHNRPAFVEAIKLREEILQKRSWDHEGTITRHFIKKLILRKQWRPTQLYERPERPTRLKDRNVDDPGAARRRWDHATEPAAGGARQRPEPVVIQVAAPADMEEDEVDQTQEIIAGSDPPAAGIEGKQGEEVEPDERENAEADECEEAELEPEELVCEGDE